jgi:hypothetical protein
MNDFTKEELKFLLCWGVDSCEIKNVETFENNKEMDIFNKIKSMIENYCDHEWVNGTYCEKCDQTPTGGK